MRAGGIPDSSRRRRTRSSPKVRSKKDRPANTTSEETPATQSGPSSATNSATPSPTPVSGTTQGPGASSSAANTGMTTEGSVPLETSASTEPSVTDGATTGEESVSASQPASPDSGIDAKEGALDAEGPPQTKEHVISMQGEQRMEDGLDGKVNMGYLLVAV